MLCRLWLGARRGRYFDILFVGHKVPGFLRSISFIFHLTFLIVINV